MELEIRTLTADERPAAGAVAGRALSNGPMFRWIAGADNIARVGRSMDLFVSFVPALVGPQIGAFIGPHLVGVCGIAPPDACLGALAPDEMRIPPEVIGPPGDPSRENFAWSFLCNHDLDERHWHLGPVAVEHELQGSGIGSAMLQLVCTRMDAEGEVAWLETDKPDNVAFYRRHGFAVVEEMTVPSAEDGFTNWFMRRDPK